MDAKRIIICCDGTWNNPEQKEVTNVVKAARALRPQGGDGTAQVVFYDWGVGSEGGFGKLTGGALGKGIDKNIQDAYRFLVHNYKDGDEICFFGFSRGAYTARSTVGLIRNVGVLKKEYAGLVFDRNYLEKIARPDVRGKLHRSRRGIYWAKKSYLRPIGKLGAELEKIHPSVRQRMAVVADYRPKNVIKER